MSIFVRNTSPTRTITVFTSSADIFGSPLMPEDEIEISTHEIGVLSDQDAEVIQIRSASGWRDPVKVVIRAKLPNH